MIEVGSTRASTRIETDNTADQDDEEPQIVDMPNRTIVDQVL
mgnify:CR=1 FL=1